MHIWLIPSQESHLCYPMGLPQGASQLPVREQDRNLVIKKEQGGDLVNEEQGGD